jgi:TM2 domain-containing membrane protein YozV
MGAHRFYYGRPSAARSGSSRWGFCSSAGSSIFFLIPGMDRDADVRFRESSVSYNVCWVLLTFLGIFGIHRFYMGKWFTGLLYLLTGGLFLLGVLYDYWTLNGQIDELAEPKPLA